MKYRGQGKKEYLVIKFDDYLNNWRVFSKPVTIGQAVWLVQDAPALKLEIVKQSEWEQTDRDIEQANLINELEHNK